MHWTGDEAWYGIPLQLMCEREISMMNESGMIINESGIIMNVQAGDMIGYTVTKNVVYRNAPWEQCFMFPW